MNVLFVSAVFPYPLHSGGQIRIYHLLKRLSSRHRITLVSFIRSEEEWKYKAKLSFCDSVHTVMRGRAWQPEYVLKSFFGKYPFLMTTYDNLSMQQTVRIALEKTKYDVLHIEPFYVWPSIPDLRIPMVVSEHNVEYDVYKRITQPLFRLDTAKLAFWETYIWKKASALTAVSAEDAAVMKKSSGTHVTVVPNGVDLKTFRYRKPKPSFSPTILFVGNFRWLPNREAARSLLEDIWPEVIKAYPGSNLWIVGKDMPKEFRAYARDADDISATYRDADIMVAPHAISGGTKFKMLEAMATGLPIVTTHEGARGLGLTPGTEYLEAGSPQEFVANIRRLCDNTVLAQTLAAAARTVVEKKYDWDTIAKKLEYVWKNA